MLKGKTSTGFEYELEDDALNDWEVLEDLTDIDDGHYGGAVRVLRRLLGDNQMKALKEHCRGENSRITQSAMVNELADILKGTGAEDEKEKNA